MSIHPVQRKSGRRFVVRYRDPDGVNRSRAFATRAAAAQFQAQVDDAKTRRRERQLADDVERF
jgi:hypothetical protein